MLRWLGRLRISGTLFVLLAAIVAPAVITGYASAAKGQLALSQKGYSAAGELYQFAARLLPWRLDLLDKAAIAYASSREWDRAMPLLEEARARGALSADAWDVLGTGYWLQLKNRDALDAWSSGLQHYPNQKKFYSRLALAYKGLGNYAAQRQALEAWLPTGQGTAVEHYELGGLLLTSDPVRARQELMLAASMQPALSQAVDSLQASLALASQESDHSDQLVVLGRGLALVNEWPLAKQAFADAIVANARNAETWAWLGEAQQQNKQDGKAALDKALELDPNSSLVHGLRGLYWKRQGKPKAALAEYQAAAKLEPKNAEWQAALGDAYTSTGDLVQALAAYVTATTLAPDNATYWRLLALFSGDNGIQVLNIGLPAAKKAAEIAPKDAQVLDTLGWTYSQAGLLNTAEQTLNEAIKVAPDLASAHLHLAETYLRQANASFARSELNRVRELDPDGPSGAYAAQLLKQYFP